VTIEQHPKLVDRFRYHYLSKDHELNLFDGARDLLNHLKANGYLLAVATGKSRKGLDRSLGFHNLYDMFADTRTADETFPKPHPAMLIELSESLAVPIEKMLMIGDTTHDLLMAKNAGVDSVALTYGAHPEHILKKEDPLICARNIQELANWLVAHG
jgi:phosphoglycolate phosphatase